MAVNPAPLLPQGDPRHHPKGRMPRRSYSNRLIITAKGNCQAQKWCWVNPVSVQTGKGRWFSLPLRLGLKTVGPGRHERQRALVVVTKSAGETRALGKALGRTLPLGTVLVLNGPVGSGKTTFLKGVGRGLGIRRTIASPSFILAAIYPLPRGRGWFCHADFYRTGARGKLPWEAVREYVGAKDSVVAIEWPRRALFRLPRHSLPIRFAHVSSTVRRLTFVGFPAGLWKRSKGLSALRGQDGGRASRRASARRLRSSGPQRSSSRR